MSGNHCAFSPCPYTDDATPQNLRAASLDRVGDAGVADRSARLRAQSRNEGGTRRAADLIEAMLH